MSSKTDLPPLPTPPPPPPLPLPSFSSFSDPVSLARIPVLLIPVGEVDKARWETWVTKIRRFTEIKLSDVPGTSGSVAKSGKARFLPPSFPPPTTSLHLDFIFAPPQTYLLPLSLFRISSSPLAVIGISDLSSQDATHANQIEQFENTLVELGLGGTSGGIYPLAKRCFGVDEDIAKREVKGYMVDEEPIYTRQERLQEPISRSGTPGGTPRRVEESSTFEGMVEIDASDDVSDPTVNITNTSGKEIPMEGKKYYDRKGHEEKMVIIPKDGNVDLVLGMLMTDLCASVLTEFGEIATALESPSGLQTIHSSLLPTLTLKPVPIGSNSTAHRPKSGNWCHIAVTNNTAPVGGPGGIGRTPSPAQQSNSETSIMSPSFSSSQPNLLDYEGRDRIGPMRSTSGMGMNGSVSNAKAFTNTPIPENNKSENRLSSGMGIKRSSTGFGFGSNVSRVLSGKGSSGPEGVGSSSMAISSGQHPGSGGGPGTSNSPVGGTGSSNSGRLKKLLGDLWLLSGRLAEAITAYSESSIALKNQNDSLWFASTMEGLATATLLEAWEAREEGNTSVIPYTASAFLTNIHDHFNHAFALYGRSPRPPDSLFPHGQESGETIVASLYVSCGLKLARTMLLSWAAGGFGTSALNALVSGGLPKVYPPMGYKFRWRVLLKLTTMSRITRNLVSRMAAKVHGPFLAALPAPVQLDTLITFVGINRLLGLERREIYFIREAVGLSLSLLLESRMIDRPASGKFGGKGTSPEEENDAEIEPTSRIGGGDTGIRKKETMEGNAGVLLLLERILDIAGLTFGAGLSSQSQSEAAAGLPTFGWPELQVEILRKAVTAAELLPDHDSVMRFSAAGLHHLVEFLSPAAQYRLHETFTEAVRISGRRGLPQANGHWWLAGDLITGMEIIPIPPNRIPYEQARSGLNSVRNDPFLYNPRAKATGITQSTLVANESFDVAVEVSNPFSFDLDIRSLTLVTSGIDCETRPLRFILPADTVQLIRLAGVAAESGKLSVDGCKVVLQDGAEKTIDVPARRPSTPFKRERQRQPLSKGMNKSLGLSARPSRSDVTSDELPSKPKVAMVLECDVVPAQPLLWIRSTSLIHGSVITYHGEQSVVKILLENTSALPVNFAKLSFDDNTAVAGRDILESGSLPSAHAFQLGTDLIERPVLKVDEEDLRDIDIQPGKTFTLSIHCLGKVGCEHGIVNIDYGFMPVTPSDTIVYSRRLALHILFTVHPSLECISLSILPWPSTALATPAESADVALTSSPKAESSSLHQTKAHQTLRHYSSFVQERETTAVLRQETLGSNAPQDQCLVLLEILNRSSIALEFTAARLSPSPAELESAKLPINKQAEGKDPHALQLTRMIPPGKIERVPVPLKRAALGQAILKRPIPVLDHRQFVVPAKDADDHRAAYVADFWFRKHLLAHLGGWWNDPTSSRAGEVVFIHSDFGGSGLEHYRKSENKPALRVLNDAGSESERFRAEDFALIELSMHNDAVNVKSEVLLFRLIQLQSPERKDGRSVTQPSDHSRHLLFTDPTEGQLSGTGEDTIGLTFLTSGTFTFGAIIWSPSSGEQWVADSLNVIVQ